MTEVSDTLKYLKPGGPREFSVMMEMFYAYCELRMPPTVSVNKGCWSIKPSHEAQGTQKVNREGPQFSIQLQQPHPSQAGAPEGTGVRERRVLALTAEVHIKGMISVSSHSYVFPNTEKC